MSNYGEAEPDGRPAMGLSLGQLAQPPPELGDPANFEDLDLSRKNLTALPDWVGQPTNLIILDLSDNQLIELPPLTGQHTSLRVLNLPQPVDRAARRARVASRPHREEDWPWQETGVA